MNRKLICRFSMFLLFALISIKGFTQVDTNTVKPYIMVCADSMVKSFSTGDYETMARFTNEKLVNMLGGKENYIAVLQKTMGEGDMAKVKIEDASIGEIIQVVKTANGFQCLVEQKLIMLFQGYRVKSISTLHGYVDKVGTLWKFADMGDKKPEQIKMIIPNFDKRLIIPKKVQTTEKI